MTDPSHRETPETRLTPAEKQALLERERARMAEPGYRESLVPPPEFGTWAHEPVRLVQEPVEVVDVDESQLKSLRGAVRSLPPWMPTPEELAAWEDEWWNMSGTKRLGPGARLLRAVRWLLEEREK